MQPRPCSKTVWSVVCSLPFVACALGAAGAAAQAGPCQLPERSTPSVQGVYDLAWGRDAALPTGSLLGCRHIPRESFWAASGSADGWVSASLERAYAFRYLTRDAAGRTLPATALLLVPKSEVVAANAPGTGSPVVALATGTVGLADHCAPSLRLRTGSASVGVEVAYYLEKGLTVLVPDYLGLGTQLATTPYTMPAGERYVGGDDHPYLEGPSAGYGLLDALRAVRTLPGARYGSSLTATLPASTPLAVAGNSQGAAVALWGALLAPSYAPELPLRAAGVAAPPVDLAATFEQVGDGLFRPLYGYMLQGYLNATHPATRGGDITALLTAEGRSLLSLARTACEDELAADQFVEVLLGGAELDELIDVAALAEDTRFATWLRENSVIAGGVPRLPPPTMPTFVIHGMIDGVVPYEPTRALFVGAWGASFSSVLPTGEAALPRVDRAITAPPLGAHITAGALERNDSMAAYRYTPYEWLWDSLYGAPRTDKTWLGAYRDGVF